MYCIYIYISYDICLRYDIYIYYVGIISMVRNKKSTTKYCNDVLLDNFSFY